MKRDKNKSKEEWLQWPPPPPQTNLLVQIIMVLPFIVFFLGIIFYGWGIFKYVPLNP